MSEVNVLDNTTGWVFILVGILVILIGAVMLAVFVWLGFKRPKYRKEHFTGHTTGTVELQGIQRVLLSVCRIFTAVISAYRL